MKYYVIMFLTFLGPPTQLFDDLQYCKSADSTFSTSLINHLSNYPLCHFLTPPTHLFDDVILEWSLIKSYIISGFPLAIAQVAGPNLAPRLRKHWTAPGFLQLIARSKGLIPLMSICSMLAPFSSKRLTFFKKETELKYFLCMY